MRRHASEAIIIASITREGRTMRSFLRWTVAPALTFAGTLLIASPVGAGAARPAFGFNGTVSGFPSGAVFLTGGGAYNLSTGFVHSGGGFRCLEDVNKGPLMGCAAGEGVRWDTAELLTSTTLKCTGAAEEMAKTATTSDTTAVLQADFYRAGDGIDESFTAQMIVTTEDLDPDIEGVQNLWVQGVGCGTAIVHFN